MAGVLLFALGGEGESVVYTAGEGWVGVARSPEVSPDPATPAALDPRLDGFESVTLRFSVAHAVGATCAVELTRDDETLATLAGEITGGACAVGWDGTDDAGALVAPGVVNATAVISRGTQRAEATTSLEVLRLGVAQVQLAGDGRVPVLYARVDGVRYGFHEVAADVAPWRLAPDARETGGTPLEEADGTARERPAIWEDVGSPPLDGAADDGIEADTYNLPTAWVAGSTPTVALTLTTAHAGGVADPELVEVRLAPMDGFAPADDAAVSDGAVVRLDATDSPAPAVGRYDVTWAWRFEARRSAADAWTPLPGRFETTHRLYGLAAEPVFDYDDVPHRAWVDVLDRVTGWVDGATADPAEVAAHIVEGVFHELGLQYDSERGASHYTDYPRGWEGASFELSRFAELVDGTTINCSDAASIVSTYANMLGVDLRYHIIQHQFRDRFELNYLHAIGREFAPSPFVSGRSAFRYHAIVGPPDTSVFDATLAVDGDDDPGSAPNELLLVQGLSESEYLTRLSPEADDVRVFIDEKVRIR